MRKKPDDTDAARPEARNVELLEHTREIGSSSSRKASRSAPEPPRTPTPLDTPSELLAFLDRAFLANSPLTRARTRFESDGSLLIEVRYRDTDIVFRWTDFPSPDLPLSWVTPLSQGILVPGGENPNDDPVLWPLRAAVARHLKKRLDALLAGSPPPLLQWRNRNPITLNWGIGLFRQLCPDVIRKNRTRYFDYLLTDTLEYEGGLTLVFQSPAAAVHLRLEVLDAPPENVVRRFGPLYLHRVHDERTATQAKDPAHQVDTFLSYFLSRNLPERFEISFSDLAPPARYTQPDEGIDMIEPVELDDTSFFEMLIGCDADISMFTTCDPECMNVFPHFNGVSEAWNLFTPWRIEPHRRHLDRFYNIRISTQSVILGLTERIREGLAAVQNAAPTPDLMVVLDSCVTRLIGEDVEGLAAERKAASDTPLMMYPILLNQTEDYEPLRTFWARLYTTLHAPSSRVADRVGFLGMAPDPNGHLARHLEDNGLRAGEWLFPGLSVRAVRDLDANGLLVVNTWDFTRTVFRDLLALISGPVRPLHLPYGVEGSFTWLDAIVHDLTGHGADRARFEARIAPDRARLDRARETLAGRRIAFFSRWRDLPGALSPRGRFGIPLLDLFREIGLGLDLHFFAPPGEKPEEADALLAALGVSEARGDRVATFTHFDDQARMLGLGDFDFVYSETYRDRRVTGAGKIPVGVLDLAPGCDGLARTAERLAAAVKSRFFSTYRAHLAPARL